VKIFYRSSIGQMVIILVILLFHGIAFPQYKTKDPNKEEIIKVEPSKLFKNLQTLIREKNLGGKSEKIIKKKLRNVKIYDNLNTDSYFAFEPRLNQGLYQPKDNYTFEISGDQAQKTVYGRMYRLENTGEAPEPQTKAIGNCTTEYGTDNTRGSSGGMGTGRGIGEGTEAGFGDGGETDENLKPAKILREIKYNDKKKFDQQKLSGEIWKNSYFSLETDFGKVDSSDYNGVSFGDNCASFFIPVSQTHYVMSFKDPQDFSLVKEDVAKFSIKDYKYGQKPSLWLPVFDSDEYDLKHIFIIKLVSPYIATETFTTTDFSERKPHTAILNQIFVDVVGVWLYDTKTGKVISDDATNRNLPLSKGFQTSIIDKSEDKTNKNRKIPDSRDSSIKILSKPKPKYTPSAEENNITGKVLLKVTFLANGRIGSVSVVKRLPHGLTEMAIAAARRIVFQPAMENGAPVTVVKTVVYSFDLGVEK
jgi:TonB family protein